MANEIYPISHFGFSKDAGFGSVYHYYTNTIVEPEEPIVVVPPIVVKPPVVVVPGKPGEPEEPKKKK